MLPIGRAKTKQRPRPSWFSRMNWEERRAWTEENWKPGHGSERDYHQVYFGKDTPEEQNALIRACLFSNRLWSTYTFQRPPTNKSGSPMTLEDTMSKMGRYYRDLSNKTQAEIYPFIWVGVENNQENKGFHFHAIECFSKWVPVGEVDFVSWKEDLFWKAFTVNGWSQAGRREHQEFDWEKNATFYGSNKHIQCMFHSPFVPKTVQKKGKTSDLFDDETITRFKHTRIMQTLRI
jgi:hypothetical protein